MVRTPTAPLGASDCEAVHAGWLAQPVNAWASLAYVVVGVLVVYSATRSLPSDRTPRVVFGALLGATGVGSVLYHGPQSAGSSFVHDLTFLTTLWFLIIINSAWHYGRRRPSAWVALGAAAIVNAIVLLASPTTTNVVVGFSILLLVASDILMHRIGGVDGRWYAAALLLLALSLVSNLLGRSDVFACDPSSLMQLHGLWHVLSAAALGAYFIAMTAPRNREPNP